MLICRASGGLSPIPLATCVLSRGAISRRRQPAFSTIGHTHPVSYDTQSFHMLVLEGTEGKTVLSEKTCISSQMMLSTWTQLHEEDASALSTAFD